MVSSGSGELECHFRHAECADGFLPRENCRVLPTPSRSATARLVRSSRSLFEESSESEAAEHVAGYLREPARATAEGGCVGSCSGSGEAIAGDRTVWPGLRSLCSPGRLTSRRLKELLAPNRTAGGLALEQILIQKGPSLTSRTSRCGHCLTISMSSIRLANRGLTRAF